MAESSGGRPADDAALELFEEFLVRHHESGVGLESLCRESPQHAGRFRTWWRQLLEAGEVSEPGSATRAEVELRADAHFAHYRLVRELGRGAQAEVWLAEDSRLGRRVALKIIRMSGHEPGRASRFAREAELASRLDHPNLCTVFERGVHRGAAFLAMRYVEGETLGAAIRRSAAEPGYADPVVRLETAAPTGSSGASREALTQVLEYFAQAADALDAAHEAGLVHRDLKPENLLVRSQDSLPVVLDFGLAQDVDAESSLTCTGDAVGTPAYMSPEQVLGLAGLDRRTDIWALGATLFEALTGRRPFEAATRAELQRAIQHTTAAPLAELLPSAPPDLGVVVATCMARHPADRYASARALAGDLRRVARGEPVLARPLSSWARALRWAQREPWFAASLAITFAALSLGLAISLWFGAAATRAQQNAERSFARLADSVALRRAEAAARALQPIGTADLSELEDWLREFGDPLAAALPSHAAELAGIRERAEPLDAASQRRWLEGHPLQREAQRLAAELQATERHLERATPTERRALIESVAHHLTQEREALRGRMLAELPRRFRSPSERALHDGLDRLVAELRGFTGPGGLLARMRAHRDWAAAAAGRVDLDAWGRLRSELAADPRFTGLELSTLAGFQPLGRDPGSGLQEFGWERSGDLPSGRDPRGRLVHGADPAMVFVLLPGADYRMGRPGAARHSGERFSKRVRLDPFLIAKHEMSRAQWQRISGRPAPTGGFLEIVLEAERDWPVEGLSWEEGDALLHEFGLELPTEAQWEYAAAAGTATRWWWGDGLPPEGAAPDNLRDRSFGQWSGGSGGWRLYDDGHAGLAPVRSEFRPNGFGLVGVYGNVAEWCREAFLARVGLEWFEAEAADGFHRLPRLGSFVVRGGTFETPPRATHTGSRRGARGGVEQPGIGLRPVRALPSD